MFADLLDLVCEMAVEKSFFWSQKDQLCSLCIYFINNYFA